jgi:hypothetical protein
MFHMRAQQTELPIPDPAAWMTRTAAAARLNVDPATVSRWAAAGILTAHYPQRAPDENGQPMFWAAEVDELAAARARAGRRRVA